MAKRRKKEVNKRWFVFFLILLIINIFVPDPIPLIDEALLAIATTYFGVKSR